MDNLVKVLVGLLDLVDGNIPDTPNPDSVGLPACIDIGGNGGATSPTAHAAKTSVRVRSYIAP